MGKGTITQVGYLIVVQGFIAYGSVQHIMYLKD